MTLPVYIITGFLGAGKTTYINSLIANQDISQHSIIIVNDFGSINIDADLIAYQQDKIIQLTNGCICCTISDTLDTQLESLLTLSDTIKDVYVETSGVANPVRVANMVLLSDMFLLKDIICMVDASQIDRFLNDTMVKSMWVQQVKSATKILLNRVSKSLQCTHATLHDINTTALISTGQKPPSQTTTTYIYPLVPPANYPQKDFKSGITSFTIGVEGAVDMYVIESIIKQYSDILLRAKGILQVQNTIKILQVSGNTISWQPTIRTTTIGQLICIGKGGNRLNMLKTALLAM